MVLTGAAETCHKQSHKSLSDAVLCTHPSSHTTPTTWHTANNRQVPSVEAATAKCMQCCLAAANIMLLSIYVADDDNQAAPKQPKKSVTVQ